MTHISIQSSLSGPSHWQCLNLFPSRPPSVSVAVLLCCSQHKSLSFPLALNFSLFSLSYFPLFKSTSAPLYPILSSYSPYHYIFILPSLFSTHTHHPHSPSQFLTQTLTAFAPLSNSSPSPTHLINQISFILSS